ncbi:MAG: hypothetical protein WCK42_06135 [Myxococcaceae bacterium]
MLEKALTVSQQVSLVRQDLEIKGFPFSASETARIPAPIFLATCSLVRRLRMRAVRKLAPRRFNVCSTKSILI